MASGWRPYGDEGGAPALGDRAAILAFLEVSVLQVSEVPSSILFQDLVKASVEGGAAPAELEQHLYHRFHPTPVRLWEGVVVVISSWC
jgi:hypothetical protein